LHTARRVPIRALLTSVVVALATAGSASAAVVIHEVESDRGVDSDFIELKNTDAAPVDISGYVLRDSNDGSSFTVAGGTTLAPGGYYLADALGFGLGSSDAARLFTSSALGSLIDSYSWAAHAVATYGRCPDGTGPMGSTNGSTPGATNNCPSTVVPLPWPGGSEIALADGVDVFGPNLSGLTYEPSGTNARGVVWAVRNKPSTLFRLVWNGTTWAPDTANGWGAGKQLLYPDGGGVPDAEGVTPAGDANALYVSTERNDVAAGNVDDISRPSVLRFDVSSPAATLTATREWALASDLPGLAANKGLEAVAWVPDAVLVAKGFWDEATGADYAPATYPGHGSGLFFVGVEASGQVIAYALDQATGAFTRVATIASGFPTIMDLHFEAETSRLWAVCDDTCDGRSAWLEIAQSGAHDGRFVPTSTVARPAGMPNLNNEGFTTAPQAECLNGRKPAFWADDSNTGGHALRSGTLTCTVPQAPGRDPAPALVPALAQAQGLSIQDPSSCSRRRPRARSRRPQSSHRWPPTPPGRR
jgi:hypothetical protein